MSLSAPLARTRDWNFPARLALLMVGLFLYGLAIRLQLDANVGLAPWDAFHQGLARRTGLTVGQASITAGLALIVAAWAALKVRPGLGSVLNMLLVGVFIDLLAPLTPHPTGIVVSWAQFALGVLLVGLATGTYIASRMGAGPRDGTVIGLSTRYRLPVGRVRTGVEVVVLLCGLLLGGHVGLGTLAFALLIGPSMAFGMRLYGLERSGGKTTEDKVTTR
ncbi:YczE/YyaS/YitT family protein [Deinococcus pimensis]|uniref:YczE/YyaS/YitT family protein n=1 Tax=Deinococcus pimensis TaxID=309888 RepID=UPI0004B3E28F|nr:membrane protein [Deinococcus pimensis]